MVTKASDQRSLDVTHISDIHYGLRVTKTSAAPASSHYFVKKIRGLERPDPRRLAALLTRVESASGVPDIVVISGDLAWSASDADYTYVTSFLRLLREDRRSSTFVVVPGNHDVDVGKRLAKDVRQSGIETLLREFYKADFEQVFPFFNWSGADDLSRRERLISIQKTDAGALVVGVNSAAAIVGLKPKQGRVFVSRRVLEAVSRYLAEHVEYQSCSLRIFVMHHHLLRIPPDAGH